MNRQTLSKKSREELNGSLLTLYQKLTFKPESDADKKEVQDNDPLYTESDADQPDQDKI
jgi:hypothetical protein